MMTRNYSSQYAPGDPVAIDGDDALRAIVAMVGFDFRGELVEVTWFSDSGVESRWFPPQRLSLREVST